MPFDIQRETPPIDPAVPIPLCKLVDAVDFFRPEFVAHLARIGQSPRLHNKQWEYAQVLEARARCAPNARRLAGLGCGCEMTIPVLCEGADEFVATDLYGAPGAWKDASRRPDQVWPHLRNLRVHTMDMRKIDLPAESFDFVSSICAIEHVGRADAIVDVVRQAGRLLRPDGVLFCSTEYTFSERDFYTPPLPTSTLFMCKQTLRRFFTETGLHLVEPLDLRLSLHPLNIPLWDQINNRGYVNLPHVLYRTQPLPLYGCYAAVVSMVLAREDRGHDRIIEDPDQMKKLAPLFALGRKMSRRLTMPQFWW
jgi:SAM-dependent methyltransferase